MTPAIRKERGASAEHTSHGNVQERSEPKSTLLSDSVALHWGQVAPYPFPPSQTDLTLKMPSLGVTLLSLFLDSPISRS